MVEAAFVEIVEEDAAQAPRFLAVLEVEVLVAPLLEARMEIAAAGVQRGLAGAVEMDRVFLEGIVRREVHAAAEPEHVIVVRGMHGLGDEDAYVHVHGGHVRVARVDHQRDTHGFPGASGQLGAMGAGRGRQRGAGHVAEQHATAFEHPPAFDQPGDAASAFGPFPGVRAEGIAFDFLQALDDAGLQAGEIGAGQRGVYLHAVPGSAGALRRVMARQPMSRRYCAPSKWMDCSTS